MKREQAIVLGLFGSLIIVCAFFVILGNFLGPFAGTNLTEVGVEGLRSTISGLVGALSMLLGGKRA